MISIPSFVSSRRTLAGKASSVISLSTPDEVASLMVGAEAVHEISIIPKALNGAESQA